MGLRRVTLWLPVILLIVDRMFLACRAALGASEAFAAGSPPQGGAEEPTVKFRPGVKSARFGVFETDQGTVTT